MLQASVFSSDLPEAVTLLGDALCRPLLTVADVDSIRPMVGYDHETLVDRPDTFIPDLIARAAFGAGLGNAQICSEERAEAIRRGTWTMPLGGAACPDSRPFSLSFFAEDLLQFRRERFTGKHVVIAGSGMPHEHLLELAEEHFGPQVLEAGPDPMPEPPALVIPAAPCPDYSAY